MGKVLVLFLWILWTGFFGFALTSVGLFGLQLRFFGIAVRGLFWLCFIAFLSFLNFSGVLNSLGLFSWHFNTSWLYDLTKGRYFQGFSVGRATLQNSYISSLWAVFTIVPLVPQIVSALSFFRSRFLSFFLFLFPCSVFFRFPLFFSFLGTFSFDVASLASFRFNRILWLRPKIRFALCLKDTIEFWSFNLQQKCQN